MPSRGSVVRAENPVVRRLGEAAVVFDPVTWQTHLLPPAAASIAEMIEELAVSGPVTAQALADAIRHELGLDPDTPAMRELLRTFREIGMLGG